ncbi:hypothetical protein H2201_002563 [Coniosporium apollinis]|uniref:Uncharacterized protein n=1 Tax=Coniosporium apollinis TaxID=61459 RepID=A0ABQ9NZ08_9PEZI|nr:hypothetical protein H2201_002563 [Coniosporium apollinis]
MARLKEWEKFVDEEPLPSSQLSDASDEDSNDNGAVIQHLGSDFPDPVSDDLRNSQSDGTSSQDLPSAQLYQEHRKMGAALSKEDTKDVVQAAARELYTPFSPRAVDRQTAAESASLVNASSAVGTRSRRRGPDHDKPPLAVSTALSRSANVQPTASGKLKRISGAYSTRSAQQPQINGKAPLPTKQAARNKPRPDTYDVIESPQKPPQSAQAVRSSGFEGSPDARKRIQQGDREEAHTLSISPKRVRKDNAGDENPPKKAAGRRTAGTVSGAQNAVAVNASTRRAMRSTANDVAAGPEHLELQWETGHGRRGQHSDLRSSHSGQKKGQDPQAPAHVVPSPDIPKARKRGWPKKSTQLADTNGDTLQESTEGASNAHAEEPEQDGPQGVAGSAQPAVPVDVSGRFAQRQSPQVVVTKEVPRPAVEEPSESGRAIAGTSPRSDPHDDVRTTSPQDQSAEAPLQLQQRPTETHKDQGQNKKTKPTQGSSMCLSKRLREEDRRENDEFERIVEDDQVLGQKDTLMGIFEGLKAIGLQKREAKRHRYHFDFLTKTGEEVATACEKAKDCYLKLAQTEDGNTEVRNRLDEAMGEIYIHTEALNANTTGEDPDDLVLDVYALIFHVLVSLLRTAILASIGHSEISSGSGVLPAPALEEIVGLLDLIEDLELRARKWEQKPDSDYCVVRPVRNGIVAPARKVSEVFSKYLQKREKEARKRKQEAFKQEQMRRREEQEAQEEEQDKRLAEQEAQWDELIIARLLLETDPRRCRSHHLAKQDREVTDWGIDANGEPFEREDMFSARRAGNRPLYNPEACQEWPDEHIDALMEELEKASEKYSGTVLFPGYSAQKHERLTQY